MPAPSKEETFPLLTLDFRLRNLFITKLDYLTVAQLEGTCVSFKQSCERLCPLFEVDCLDMFPGKQDWLLYKNTGRERKDLAVLPTDQAVPCRIYAKKVRLEGILTKNKLTEYVDRIRLYQLTATELEVEDAFLPEDLVQIIEALKVSEIETNSRMTKREICSYEVFQNLSSIDIGPSDIRNEDLLKVKAPNIDTRGANGLTLSVIPSLIMQWKRGNRKIRFISLSLSRLPFSPIEYRETAIEGLDATELWVELDPDGDAMGDRDSVGYTVHREDNTTLTIVLRHCMAVITSEPVGHDGNLL